MVSEQRCVGGREKREETRMQSWLPLIRVSLSCGAKGVSVVTVVFVALATRVEIDYAQCRCTRVEWAHFL